MKIGLVCPYNLLNRGGGVQECVFAMQTELSLRGHDVLIISFQPRDYSGVVPSFVRLLGRGRDVKSPFNTTGQISVTVDMGQVDKLMQSEKFDILHFHEPWVPLLSHQLLMRSKAKNIATFHAKLPDTVMSRTIEKVITPYTKSLLKYFPTMTAVSDAAAMYVRSLTDHSINIIPNGIDLIKYNKLEDKRLNTAEARQNSKHTESILYIGRLERRKGVKFLLKAVKKLQKATPNVKLLIAGDGPDRAGLERYAREQGIQAEFLGRISESDKLKLLREVRVFCSPARYGESFGIVLLEAMACGLPVVAGNNPGYATVLKDAGSMSLVDSRDIQEFANKLDVMMHDQSARKIWQKWAAAEVKQYNYKNIVDQYEKLYNS